MRLCGTGKRKNVLQENDCYAPEPRACVSGPVRVWGAVQPICAPAALRIETSSSCGSALTWADSRPCQPRTQHTWPWMQSCHIAAQCASASVTSLSACSYSSEHTQCMSSYILRSPQLYNHEIVKP
eukprot:2942361-Rhodomonas_salina.1